VKITGESVMNTKASIQPRTKSELAASVRTIMTKVKCQKMAANGGGVEVVQTTVQSNVGKIVPMVKKTSIDKPIEFKIGDMVVYPSHGVGQIKSFATCMVAGVEHRFYEIAFGDESSSKGMIIKVPVAQAQSVGLRRVVDKDDIEHVYAILRDRSFKVDTQTWNRRYREYSQKIKTGSVFEIAEVMRDLSVLGGEKDLSFGEKKMLDTAQALLVSEIAVARARPPEKIQAELQALFVNCC